MRTLSLRSRAVALGLLVGLSGLSALGTTRFSLPAAQAATGGAPIMAEDPNDVMGGARPKMPTFPKLAKKPGYLRGFVKDTTGKPVAGAKVLVSSSEFGGFRSGATGVTDARGYYEVRAPIGMARAYCAGYGKMYNGTYLSLSLHAADGEIDDFYSKEGHVENFALLTWGVVDEAKVNQDPRYMGNYYGGSFTLEYFMCEPDDQNAPASNLPHDATLEVTLTPDGPLADGTAGRPIVIRQLLDYKHSSYTQFNNVPVGRYKILAKLLTKDGKAEALKLRDNNGGDRKGGLTPKEAVGEATILFWSNTSTPGTNRIPGGSMECVRLRAERAVEKAQ